MRRHRVLRVLRSDRLGTAQGALQTLSNTLPTSRKRASKIGPRASDLGGPLRDEVEPTYRNQCCGSPGLSPQVNTAAFGEGTRRAPTRHGRLVGAGGFEPPASRL